MMVAVLLEEGTGDVSLRFQRHFAHRGDGRVLVQWQGVDEQAFVFVPAEIMAFEQFRRQHDIDAVSSGAGGGGGHCDIGIAIAGEGQLQAGDGDGAGHDCAPSARMWRAKDALQSWPISAAAG